MHSFQSMLNPDPAAHGITFVERDEPESPQCSDCNNTGYIRHDVPLSDPRFGRMFPCPNADCPVRRDNISAQVDKVMKARGSWDEQYDQMTFATFEDKVATDKRWIGKRGAYAIARAFAEFDEPFDQNSASMNAFGSVWPKAQEGLSRSVVLTGDVGLGKTGLAIAAANALMARGKVPVFIRLPDLIQHIQETYAKDWQDENFAKETGDSRIQFFVNAPYLIIDEFEMDDMTTDRKRIVEAVIRGRADVPHAPPFMITTNLSQDEIASRWGKRIADVVWKAHIVPMGGPKLRQTMRTANGDW